MLYIWIHYYITNEINSFNYKLLSDFTKSYRIIYIKEILLST